MSAISIRLSNLLRKAAEFLEGRVKRASREKFLKVLKSAPDVEPDEDDKL